MELAVLGVFLFNFMSLIHAKECPLIVAHRGSPGMLPEHTVEGYRLAIDQGADYIECDLAITKDLHLICLHEAWMKNTTNIATHPEFHDRISTQNVSGKIITDYFAPDFTLDEIKRLRKVQQLPFRDQRYNGQFEIATFDEYVQVAKNANRTVGIYPEIKDPKWHNNLKILQGKRIEDIALDALTKHGYTKKSDPCIVQSFDEDTLKYMASKSELKLLMLTENDVPTDQKLDDWSKFAYAVGPSKTQIITVTASISGSEKKKLDRHTNLIEKCHQRNMKVHAYTFRNEDEYLPVDFGQDPYAEYETYEKLGLDGFFTDFTASFKRYLKYTQPTCNGALGNGSELFIVISACMLCSKYLQ